MPDTLTIFSHHDAVPGTLTIFSHRVTVVKVFGSKFLLYHFGRNTTGTLIEPVYPIKEPASLSPWRLTDGIPQGERSRWKP